MPSHDRKSTVGRPRRKPGELRRHTLRISVSDTELKAIRARAIARRQRLSVYGRGCCLLGSAQATEQLDALARFLAQMRGVAANINQASHRANIALCADPPDRAALEREQSEIVAMLPDVRGFMRDTRALLKSLTGAQHRTSGGQGNVLDSAHDHAQEQEE